MKLVKKTSIGIHPVYNTNVNKNHNYLNMNGSVSHNCVVDANYRGIVHVHMFNNSDEEVVITEGQKIAQFMVIPCWKGMPKQVESVDQNTDRGTGGFGSSGTH